MPQKHDPLYKELIKAFFREFIQFTVPALDVLIDYRTVKFLDKEISDIFTNQERRLDIFVEAKIKKSIEIIHVHIEIESTKNMKFNFRMWDYFSQIHRKFKKPVIPIALFVDGSKWIRPVRDTYVVEFNNEVYLKFKYHQFKMNSFKVSDYLTNNNPLIKALLVKMDMSNLDGKRIKLDILHFLGGKKNLGSKREILYNFVRTYLVLSPQDEVAVEREAFKEPEVKKMIKTFKDGILEEGIEQGIEQGIEKGIQQASINRLETELISWQIEIKEVNELLKAKSLSKEVHSKMLKRLTKNLKDTKNKLKSFQK